MKEPIKGDWYLFYDESTLILKEEFIIDPDSIVPEDRKPEIPKCRAMKFTDWESFKHIKDLLNYPESRAIPKELFMDICDCHK